MFSRKNKVWTFTSGSIRWVSGSWFCSGLWAKLCWSPGRDWENGTKFSARVCLACWVWASNRSARLAAVGPPCHPWKNITDFNIRCHLTKKVAHWGTAAKSQAFCNGRHVCNFQNTGWFKRFMGDNYVKTWSKLCVAMGPLQKRYPTFECSCLLCQSMPVSGNHIMIKKAQIQ